MTSRRELEYIKGDLAAIERLLEEIPESHLLERASLAARRDALSSRLADAPMDPLASVSVVFGGEPVFGELGIDVKFGAKALDSFQRAVGAAAASRAGASLGQRGPLPDIQSRLLLTSVVHGSFGFTLEELSGEPDLWEHTALSGAVDDVEQVLESLAAVGPESFSEIAGDVDPRVITALREFVTLVDGANATFRVHTPEREVVFDPENVESAKQQLSTFTLREDNKPLSGILLGILPVSRRFELRLTDETVIRGRIGREIADPESLRHWEGARCTAFVRVTTVESPEKPGTPRYTLQRIEGAL